MQSSQKLKIFYNFFIAFLEKTSNFSHTEKSMGFIAQVIPKILIRKNVVT